MQNLVQEGKVLDLVAPSGGVVSGTVYKIGTMIVAAQYSAAEGEIFTGLTEGVLGDYEKAAVATTVGADAYWDDSAKKFTTTSGGNTKAGRFLSTTASGDTIADVLLRWA